MIQPELFNFLKVHISAYFHMLFSQCFQNIFLRMQINFGIRLFSKVTHSHRRDIVLGLER